MVKRNARIAALKGGYLFPEIRKRKEVFLASRPAAKLISLGVGDTSLPLVSPVVRSMVEEAEALGSVSGYHGYPPEQGDLKLRQGIAKTLYRDIVSPEDIFLSDGSKCDVGRLQILFGSDVTIAAQDPVYPVYVDTGIMMGSQIKLMPCTPENGFFPEMLPEADILFFCSPNNPTGAAATKAQLETLVAHARKTGAIILFDAAYAAYIRQGPRSIYEIEGAELVAIEMGSFSKMAGFTGVRLGWTVVPEALKFADGSSVKKDWHRVVTTFFNGPSHVAVAGGLEALKDDSTVPFYLESTHILKQAFLKSGYRVYGGDNAPYLFVGKGGLTSWELFDKLLHELEILTIPGSGFGPSGEGFVRVSAFAPREQILEASNRIGESLV